jgi:chromosome segregation ATPase
LTNYLISNKSQENLTNKLRSHDQTITESQHQLTALQDQLDQLEKEKSNLADLLEQAEEKISQLESSLLTANNQIQELELKIKDLETNHPHSTELVKLKQELIQLKSSSQSELNSLKNQLQQAKLSEEQLQQKLQALTSKLDQEPAITADSFWTKVKTPLFYGLAIIFILLTFKLAWNKLKFQ